MTYDEYGRALLTFEETKLYKVKDRRSIQELLYNKSEFMKIKIKANGGVYHDTHCSMQGKFFGMPSLHKTLNICKEIDYPELPINLRAYQKKTIEYIEKSKSKGILVEAMTGAGKTWILLGLIKLFGIKTVIVVKNKRLQKQIYDDIISFYENVTMINGSKNIILSNISVLTNTTFVKIRASIQGQYDLLIIDEAHNCPKSIRDAMCCTQAKRIIGLTATPERIDWDTNGLTYFYGDYVKVNEEEIKATGAVVDVVVYTYKYHTYITLEDYRKANISEQTKRPYNEGSHHIMRNILTKNKSRYQQLSNIIQKFQSHNMDTFIVFCDRTDHAQATYEFLSTALDCPVFLLNGKTKNPNKVVEQYKEQGGVLVGNVSCVGDGFNVPRIQVGIQFYNTTTKKNIVQNAGRARRAHNGKKYAFFVDFQDAIQLEGKGKKKELGGNQRNKIYREMGRIVKPLIL